jgi:MYXO-CTERM domain-containing protein
MRSYRLRMSAVTALGALMIGLPMCASPDVKQGSTREATASTPEELTARATIAATPMGRVVSRGVNGAARFIVGAADATAPALGVNVETAARLHLARNASSLGLGDGALRNASVSATHAIPGGGSVVQFKQYVGGLPVYRGSASVVLDAAKNLVSIAANLHAGADGATFSASGRAGSFRMSAEQVLAGVYAAHSPTALPMGAVRDMGPRNEEWRAYKLATAPGALRIVDAGARRVLFPEGDRLIPAYDVHVITRAAGKTENDGHSYVVAGEDGRVLYHAATTLHDAFKYKLWADPAGNHTPADGPLADYSPHPTGLPDGKLPAYVAPVLVSMEGFNKNPAGAADPWLDAAATKTSGNNVVAYSDRDDLGQANPDGGSDGNGLDSADVQADLTLPVANKSFDRVYDVTKQPNASSEQIKAAVTSIFYVTNWMHDYWYDSGFNEAAGNGQLSNLGRGGTEGDPLLAEAQDGADHGQANNANMDPSVDGMSPRMQMYVWSGTPVVSLTGVPAVAFADSPGRVPFAKQTFDVTAPAAIADDGTAPTSDACTAVADLTGKIAIIDRGTCALLAKVAAAQTAKAVGVIIINNVPGHQIISTGQAPDPTVDNMPVLTLTQEDGAALRAKLATGAVTLHMTRGAEILHDGTIDNTIVAHEWGHYLHHRLEECGGPQCNGMSEGWADFNAMMMVVREGDKVTGGVYALSQYAGAGLDPTAGYFGIRRMPYSTDLTRNSLTFTDIRDSTKLATTAPTANVGNPNSEAHNAGEVWAQTMFEAYAALLDTGAKATPPRGFDESKRRMADYVVAGMKATPPEATFTEQRDAVLSVVWASGHKDDFAAMAGAFAKRGMGVGAESPPGGSSSFDEAVENFDFKANVNLAATVIDDKAKSCDNDGILDSGESGTVTLTVRNTGWLPLTKTKVTVSSSSPALTFDNKGVVDVPALDPFASATVKVGVTAVGDVSKAVVPLSVNLSDPDSFKPSADIASTVLVSADDKAASSATDDVESEKSLWTLGHGKTPKDAWARTGDAANHLWHGADVASPADESLVSPSLTVSATDKLTIAFSHSFQFESGEDPTQPAGSGVTVYYDGGVLEISPDDGKTWEDISKYADPGYPNTVFSIAGQPSTNVLAGRKAFTGELAGFPAAKDVKLDLGTQLAGKTIKVRFRIGTDDASGTEGWNIDNLTFGGITTTPFSTVVSDAKLCGSVTPDAGTNGATPADDSGCSCGVTPGHAGASLSGLGLLGGVMAFFARRRRSRA